jgi:glucose-1-phosphate thymidylyltransferase
MKALILAAGYATRLYPLNQKLPKALLPIGNETILDHIINLVQQIPDCQEIILVSNHKFIEIFERWLASYKGSLPVKLLDDGTTGVEKSLGAIGDICYAIEQEGIDEELLILAGDSYFDFSLTAFLENCRQKKQDGVCVKVVEDPTLLPQMGVVLLDQNKNIINIEEKPAQPKSNLAMYAIYYYTADTIRLFQQYRREENKMDAPGNFIVWLYSRKPITTYMIDGQCHDVGSLKTYSRLCESLGLVLPGEDELQ